LVSLPLITLFVRLCASTLSSSTMPAFPFTFDRFPLTKPILLHVRLSTPVLPVCPVCS
jgi:hypothetical protein